MRPLLCTALLALPLAVCAQATTPAQPAAVPPVTAMAVQTAPAATGSLLQTLLALIFVLGLLAALAWFLKRFAPRAGTGGANLRLVGALNIGGRERIMVVEVGEQWIVVGASPGRINALATMPKQQGIEPEAAAQPPAAAFADWLKQTIDKRNAK
ncbi:flagellar biosynthetic protein FliO [Massilia horti]|nr:flagellar biosynthetic protein FliO [Massilia horti]